MKTDKSTGGLWQDFERAMLMGGVFLLIVLLVGMLFGYAGAVGVEEMLIEQSKQGEP